MWSRDRSLSRGGTIGRGNTFKGFQVGFRWGLGHGLGVVILGLLGMLCQGLHRYRILVSKRGSSGGMALDAVGLWVFGTIGLPVQNDRSRSLRQSSGIRRGIVSWNDGFRTLTGCPTFTVAVPNRSGHISECLYLCYRAMMGFGWLLSKVVSSVGSLRTWTLLTATASIGVGLYWILVQTA